MTTELAPVESTMYVEFGNATPTARDSFGEPLGPTVTTIGPLSKDPDTGYSPHSDAKALADALARHIATAPGGVTRVGDISGGTGHHEAFLAVVAGWRAESNSNPTWVWSDNRDFAVLLSQFFGCPVQERQDA